MQPLHTSDLVRSYKMEIITDPLSGVESVFIVKDDGSILSMLKSTYDEQQAALNAQEL